jgi:hypothetical protein
MVKPKQLTPASKSAEAVSSSETAAASEHLLTAGHLREKGIPVPFSWADQMALSVGPPMSDADLGRLVFALVAQLPAVERVPQISCDIAGVQRLLGCRSRSATYRELTTLGVKPYAGGKYFINEIHNAVARRSRARNASA